MQTLKRAPPKIPPSHLCFQCRLAHATKTKRENNILALKYTAQDLAERASILRTRVHAARKARREDWLLGPLAPNRFAASEDHGCVEVREMNGVRGLELTRQGRSPYMPREMSWKESLIKEGDRVAVVAEEGPASRERGKVGRVKEVRKSTGECIVEDLNMADIKVPNYAQEIEPGTPAIRAVPLPIPLSAVRLVYPLKVPEQCDPTSGAITRSSYYQDTIISRLVKLPGQKGRFIANSNRAMGEWVEIPNNPSAEDEGTAPSKDHDADTLRFEVEESTWTPTLLRAPMPAGVIDELRSKYSRHRTRHDPGYQLALDNRQRRKEEWKAWVKSAGGMLNSPAKEARAKEVYETKKEKGKPELKREVLERIGEVMARQGIELSKDRQKELERNLASEEVLRGSVEVGKGKEVLDDGARVDGQKAHSPERDLQQAMQEMGVDELVVKEAGGSSPRL